MSLRRSGNDIAYESHRPGAEFVGTYGPVSPMYRATAGSLEHWLTERYCLYAKRRDGALFRNDVHHEPWPLQKAQANLITNTMLTSHGLGVDGPPAHLHFSQRVSVVVWGGDRVR